MNFYFILCTPVCHTTGTVKKYYVKIWCLVQLSVLITPLFINFCSIFCLKSNSITRIITSFSLSLTFFSSLGFRCVKLLTEVLILFPSSFIVLIFYAKLADTLWWRDSTWPHAHNLESSDLFIIWLTLLLLSLNIFMAIFIIYHASVILQANFYLFPLHRHPVLENFNICHHLCLSSSFIE